MGEPMIGQFLLAVGLLAGGIHFAKFAGKNRWKGVAPLVVAGGFSVTMLFLGEVIFVYSLYSLFGPFVGIEWGLRVGMIFGIFPVIGAAVRFVQGNNEGYVEAVALSVTEIQRAKLKH